MAFTYSQYQLDVFDFTLNGQGNGIIKAVAGGAKSTTIVECYKRLIERNPNLRILFLAFNADIVKELKAKGVNAKTFNSLGFWPTANYKGEKQATLNKLQKLCDDNLSAQDDELYSAFVRKLVGLGRQSGLGCLVQNSADEWQKIIDHHDMQLESLDATYERAIELAGKLLEVCFESSMFDFDDMLYTPVRARLRMDKYDFIFIDEQQDTNAIQLELISMVMHETTRLIGVGDENQSIYGFRGAQADSMELFRARFNCKVLPLSVSYRCSQAVVDYAKQWCPQIEAAPNAPKGSVEILEKWNASTFKAGDLVVCRTTAPLVDLAYKLLRAKVPMRVLGRDIGQGMRSLVNKLKAKGIDQLQMKLDKWLTRETEKAKAKKDDSKVQSVNDKAMAINVLIDSLPETERTIPGLLAVIDNLFGGVNTKDTPESKLQDAINRVRLATIHKAKGLEVHERHHVCYWLERSKCPSKWAKQDWQQVQERNLCLVASSRAKDKLVLIESQTEIKE